MGWMIGWNSKQGLVEHLLKQEGGNCDIVKHSIVGNNLWCLMQRKGDGLKFVVLFKLGSFRSNGNVEWGYKDIDESTGPCETNCPKYLIDAADPPAGKYAEEWRAAVAKAREAKRGKASKASKAFIEGLKSGDVFYCSGKAVTFLFFYTNKVGQRRIAGRAESGSVYRYPISKISAAA